MQRSITLAKFFVLFLALAMIFTATAPPQAADAQVYVTVSFGPPPIPYYVQPPAPQPNYIWSPGYWAYQPHHGYYWVPGTWVAAPEVGQLWTPAYWAWNGNAFAFYPGYWAPQVGYYGGVNYGYGYYGRGYEGGKWQGRVFAYNTAITNVNRTVVHNVYINRTVVVNTWNRTSYNGGKGGIQARPDAREVVIQHEKHYSATPVQVQHARVAAANPAFASSVNHGKPPVAAVAHPYNSEQRAAVPPSHAVAPPERRVPEQHANTAPQQHAAPAEHTAPQQHAAAPQEHAAPQQHGAPEAKGQPQPGQEKGNDKGH